MSKNLSISVGPGIGTLLGLLFVGLKLTGFITWSWFYVTMPFWLPWAIIFGFLAFWGILLLILALLK
jgi:hypothetical protein